MDHRADAGNGRTGQQGRLIERHGNRQRHQLRLMNDSLGGEGGRAHSLNNSFSIQSTQGRRRSGRQLGRTQALLAAGTKGAIAARAHQGHYYRIAWLHYIDTLPHFFNHARGFMAVNGGQLSAPAAIDIADIAVADGDRLDPHPNRIDLRGSQVQCFNGERRAVPAAYSRPDLLGHPLLPASGTHPERSSLLPFIKNRRKRDKRFCKIKDFNIIGSSRP